MIGWVAVVALLLANGDTAVAAADEVFKTEAACIAKQAEAKPKIDASQMVIGYTQLCVQVTVKAK